MAVDSLYPYTNILLHMEGANTGTVFTDTRGKVVCTASGATTVTAQYKYGSTSCLLNGSSNYISIANVTWLDLQDSDFCVEAFVRLSGYSASYGGVYQAILFAKSSTTVRTFDFSITGTSNSWTGLQMRIWDSGAAADTLTASYTFSLNTWYHVAFVRSGGTGYIFVDGASQTVTGSFTRICRTTTDAARIGASAITSNGYFFPGHIDEFRLTQGQPRYTENFTPAAADDTPVTNLALPFKSGLTYDTTQQSWQEQWWHDPVVISGRSCQRYWAVGQGLPRPQSVAQPITSASGWLWYHPGQHRTKILVHANRTYVVTVAVTCSDTTSPRPTLRLLASGTCGVAEQTSVMPSVANVEQILTLTFTPTGNGVLTLQQEWWAIQAMTVLPENTCAWRTLSVQYYG